MGVSVILLFAQSCQQNELTPISTSATNLTSGSWRAVQLKQQNTLSGVTYPATYPSIDACILDNRTTFTIAASGSNGAYTTNNGTLICNGPVISGFTNGTWSLVNGNTQLQITENGSTFIYNILELTTSRMKYSWIVDGINTHSYNEMTLEH